MLDGGGGQSDPSRPSNLIAAAKRRLLACSHAQRAGWLCLCALLLVARRDCWDLHDTHFIIDVLLRESPVLGLLVAMGGSEGSVVRFVECGGWEVMSGKSFRRQLRDSLGPKVALFHDFDRLLYSLQASIGAANEYNEYTILRSGQIWSEAEVHRVLSRFASVFFRPLDKPAWDGPVRCSVPAWKGDFVASPRESMQSVLKERGMCPRDVMLSVEGLPQAIHLDTPFSLILAWLDGGDGGKCDRNIIVTDFVPCPPGHIPAWFFPTEADPDRSDLLKLVWTWSGPSKRKFAAVNQALSEAVMLFADTPALILTHRVPCELLKLLGSHPELFSLQSRVSFLRHRFFATLHGSNCMSSCFESTADMFDEHHYPRPEADLTLLGAMVAESLVHPHRQGLLPPLNPAFWKYLLCWEHTDNTDTLMDMLRDADSKLHKTLMQSETDTPYTVPGTDIRLSRQHSVVTASNHRLFVNDVCRHRLRFNKQSFITGFNQVLHFETVAVFLHSHTDWIVLLEQR